MPRVVTVVPRSGEVAPVPWISSIAIVTAGSTVMVKVAVAVASAESAAVTVTLYAPAWVGVPVTSPVAAPIRARREAGGGPRVRRGAPGGGNGERGDRLPDRGGLVGDGVDGVDRLAGHGFCGSATAGKSRSPCCCRQCPCLSRCGSATGCWSSARRVPSSNVVEWAAPTVSTRPAAVEPS